MLCALHGGLKGGLLPPGGAVDAMRMKVPRRGGRRRVPSQLSFMLGRSVICRVFHLHILLTGRYHPSVSPPPPRTLPSPAQLLFANTDILGVAPVTYTARWVWATSSALSSGGFQSVAMLLASAMAVVIAVA